MSFSGRIVKADKKSTLLWNNGIYHKLSFKTSHNIGDIIDKDDNLITECLTEYKHAENKKNFDILKAKFLYLKKIRIFFEDRGFLEVSTPKLKKGILNEINISAIKTPYGCLTPSPEAEMKKLISLGFDKLFELCYAYRDDYENSLHKKEFLILEWYRAFKKPQAIIDDFIELIQYMNKNDRLIYKNLSINLNNVDYIEYKDLFLKYIGIDIENFDSDTVKNIYGIEGSLSRLDILDAVFGLKIEKKLGLSSPVVVYNFPAQRAALSKIKNGYAKRFEMYIAGVELSNCYDEENDYSEIQERFHNTDNGFFEAMKKGIPQMSGIAVGVDRLIMLLENLPKI